MDPVIARRIVARYIEKRGMEHPSPEALKEYLHEHPGADKSKHHVHKPDGDHGHKDDEHDDKPIGEKLKGWGAKALGFFKKAPEAVQKFVMDDDFRRKALLDAHKKLINAPEELKANVIKTVKHEIHEFKEAGAGVKAVLSGKEMSKEQKKALKTVGLHIGLTVAATVLTASGGPLVAAGAFGKSMVKHVAMKSVTNALGHLHMLEELGHIGHGIGHLVTHLAAEEKKLSEDEIIARFFMAAVAKEIKDLDLDGIKAAFEDASKDDEPEAKTASYFRA